MNPAAYPEITALIKTVSDLQISIEAMPRTPDEAKIFYRRLKMIIGDNSFIIPVDDEYEDVQTDPGNTALMLHLILSECVFYKESEDYLVWCKDAGLSASRTESREMYFELRESAIRILEIMEGKAAPLSNWDFSMNTGITQALRAVRKLKPT
ncbi:MAG: hypothetical protein GY751_03700 [Bacteroidetes bacterium]|nr:hypothetical protein [Bacteroidota bacterium]